MATNTETMDTLTSIPASAENRVLRKQLDLLSQNLGSTLLTGALTIILFAYIIYHPGNANQIIAWSVLSILVIFFRYLLHNFFLRHRVEEERTHSWLRLHYIGTALTGTCWGFAGVYFMPSDPFQLAIMVIILGGVSAGTTATYAPIRWLSACVSLPTLMPFSLNLILLGSEQTIMVGIVSLAYMAVMIITSESVHRETTYSLKLGFENLDLAHASTAAREETHKLNIELMEEIETRREAEDRIESSERELKRILENMADTYYRTDIEGKITRVSSSVKTLLGFDTDEVLGTRMSDLYRNPSDREAFIAELNKGNGNVMNYPAPIRRKDGSMVWVATNAHYLYDDQNNIIGVEGTTRDISALKDAEQALYDEKEKAEVTLRSIGDGVITTDVQGRIDYMNPVAEELTGWRRSKAYGKRLTEIITLTSEDSGKNLGELLPDDSVHNVLKFYEGDLLLRNRHNNHEYAVEITTSDLNNASGNCRGAVMVFHDVTKLRGMAREMSYQATHDNLTGLINRVEFERRMESALESTMIDDSTHHALMYMDLDQFKVVNDTCGHIAGDELLKQLTYNLRSHVRGSDVLARLGGDEFGVLLENCPIKKAQDIAEDLRNLVQEFRFVWEGKVFEIGVSIGLVAITETSGDLASVLSAADSACYVAKDLGRNRVHVFHNEDEEVTLRHGQMQWIHRIKHALEEDRFELFCQTVKPLGSDNDVGDYHEVLVRLIDENGELVAPNNFIPAAERYHLMTAIDRWVVNAAINHFDQNDRLKDNEVLAMNLSGQSLVDEGFLEFLETRIQECNIPAWCLCFEITETAAIINISRAVQFMNRLRKMGCRFALDDFGSGLSSFAYLQRMPVDFLKIDGVFVRDILTDHVHAAMVDSINHIGHVFGMRTIAEFVENDAILEKLRQIKVNYAQGFGVSRPKSLFITTDTKE